MDDADYRAMMYRLRERLAAAEKQAQQCREAIAGLELAWRLAMGRRGDSGRRPKGEVLEAVRRAIDDQIDGKSFGVNEIEAKIKAQDQGVVPSRTSIASALRRLCQNGELTLVQQGKGRRQSLYDRKPSQEVSSSTA